MQPLVSARGLSRIMVLVLIFAAMGCAASAAPKIPSVSPVLGTGAAELTAPLFTLPSASGDQVSLDSYAGKNNVVLVFYRGFW